MNGPTLTGNPAFSPESIADTDWQIQGLGDFNRDGFADVLWRHSDGSLSLWLMDGQTRKSNFSLSPGRVADKNWQIQGTGDFDADGQPDILWRHTDGSLRLWLMDGSTLRYNTQLSPGTVADLNWQIQGVGDFDADGYADILWRHTSGNLSLWLMSSGSLRENPTLSPGKISDVNWQIQGVGDFDGDGQADILWRHTSGSLSLWLMDGPTLRANPPLSPGIVDPAWKIQLRRAD